MTITVVSTDGSELMARCEVTIMPSAAKVFVYDGEAEVTGKSVIVLNV